MSRLVVTGCGRSGTQHLERLISHLGFRSGHEKVFRYDLDPFQELHLPELEARWVWPKDPTKELLVEVSWLAAPFLECVPQDWTIWHLVRDPRLVVRCWAQHDLVASHNGGPMMVRSIFPEVGNRETPLARAVSYVYQWNRLVPRKAGRLHYRLRVEDLVPVHLGMLLSLAGLQTSREKLDLAFEETPKGTGGCSGEHKEVTWDEILATPDGPALREQALSYGYEV